MVFAFVPADVSHHGPELFRSYARRHLESLQELT
jgi:hypothetical protein